MRTYTARYRKGSSVHDYIYMTTTFTASGFRQVVDVAERVAERRGIVLVSLTLKDD